MKTKHLKYVLVIPILLVILLTALGIFNDKYQEDKRLTSEIRTEQNRQVKDRSEAMTERQYEFNGAFQKTLALVDKASSISPTDQVGKKKGEMNAIQDDYLDQFDSSAWNDTTATWYSKSNKQDLTVSQPSVETYNSNKMSIFVIINTKSIDTKTMHKLVYSFKKHAFVQDEVYTINGGGKKDEEQ